MDILKAFKLNNEEYKINIQGSIDEPLFHSKQIGQLLNLANIRKNLKDFSDDEKIIIETYSNGGIQKTLFLTELGLYRLLGRSNKPIANTFQKWMVSTIKEIRINGIYQLNEKNIIDKQLIEYNCNLKNHKIFLKSNENKNVVYICKLKDFENKFIIKIGSSQSLKERISHISNSFNLEQILLLEVIQSDNHTKFERFLHKNDFIKNYFYPIQMKDGNMSKETYLVNQEQFNEIIKITNDFKYNFENKDNKSIEELRLQTEIMKENNEKIILKQKELDLEQKKLDLEQKKIEYEIKKIEYEINKTNIILDENNNDIDSDSDSSEELNDNLELNINANYKIKSRKNGIRIPKVYQYDPNDLKNPIKIFDSPADVEREYSNISLSPLKNAYKNNTIYKDFRWLFLKRDENIPEYIPETQINKHISPDIKFLAMIDIKQTQILNVFCNQKEAVEARNLKSNSFTRAIKNGSISSGHYWKFFDDCSEEMKDDYFSRGLVLPQKYIPKSGKRVQQIDPKNNEIIAIHNSIRDVVRKFQMSHSSLKKSSDSEIIHNGYKWKLIL
jgi:prophage antirepressor-like protein